MIAKERNPQEHPETDVFSRAGAEAEHQMAHYLRRAFADNPDIAVFNDLRIVDDAGEVAQFDHLIFHRRGFIVIESKSVTSAVCINEQGEWMREWNRKWDGMPSPIRQAQRQIDLFKKVLSTYQVQLRDKMLLGKLQKGFGVTPFEILIAISDKGRIDRNPHTPPEVHKAEAIVERAKETIAKHRMGFFSAGMDNGLEKFSDNEFAAICNFLARRHAPLHAPARSASKSSPLPATASVGQTNSAREAAAPYATQSNSAPTAAPRPSAATASTQAPPTPEPPQQACPKCHATDLAILHSAYGYYWKCNACAFARNTDHSCPKCGEKTKTHKKGPRFHRDCPKCNTSEYLYTNPEKTSR